MKRTFLLLFFLRTVFPLHAQQIMKTETRRFGTWNIKSKEWIYTDSKPYNVRFTFHGKTILVDDESKSVYTLKDVKEEVDNEKSYRRQWEATDESGKFCYVTLAWRKGDGEIIYTISYPSGFVIQYGMKKSTYKKG